MTDPKILSAVAAIVRPTFRHDADRLPHPDETALVHRLADWVEGVLDSHLGILENAYAKGWYDCKRLAKVELDAQQNEFVAMFSEDRRTELRAHAAAHPSTPNGASS